MHTRFVLAALVIALALPGCGQPCFDDPTRVALMPSARTGIAPFEVSFEADAAGRVCGCCGNEPPREIVGYAWDLDGDGTFESEGSELTRQVVRFEEPGEHVIAVRVTDSRGERVESRVTVTVLSADAGDEELLGALVVRHTWMVDAMACTREQCVLVRSDFGLDLDELVFEAAHGDGDPVVDVRSEVPVGPDEMLLCATYTARESGWLRATLRRGDAERVEHYEIRDATGLCPER